MNKNSTLAACNATKLFDGKSLFTDVSVEFASECSYALMGSSGSGKSTLMHLLAGLDVPTQGSITLDSKLLTGFSSAQRAKHLGLVLQTPLFVTELTVLENILLAGKLVGLNASELHQRAKEYLTFLGLWDTRFSSVGSLSGGQRQRIALVRALITQPKFLLADEPTGNLDEQSSNQLMKILLLCKQKWGMGLIVSTHSKEIAKKMEVVFTIKNGILVPAT